MIEETASPRLSLRSPRPEDNAAAAYQQIAEVRAASSALERLREMAGQGEPPAAVKPDGKPAGGDQGGDPGAPAAAAAEDGESAPAASPAASPAADATPDAGGAEFSGWKDVRDMTAGVLTGAGAVGKDVVKGLTEAPAQVVGGVIDALGEMDQFMQELIPIGGVELFDEEGNFDISLVSSGDMAADREAEQTIFDMIAPDKADSVTGGFVRATSQFLTAFIPGMQATKGMAAMKGGAVLASMTAGAIADVVAFDPNEDRLSTFLNQVPALSSIVPDYLADNNPDQAAWEGRLKNAIEGLGLGVATDALMGAFRYYKAARKANTAAKAAADPTGFRVQAAKDAMKQAAREELVNDIPDEALRGLGLPDGPALVKAAPDETAERAFSRISEATTRAAKADADKAALTQINSIRERFAKGKGVDAAAGGGMPGGRDYLDDMLDELRSNAVTNAKISKRPVAAIVKGAGGIDPTSSLAGDLRSRGITAKSFPGLFRKGGRASLDNIPASEIPLFSERNLIDPSTGYIPEQAFIDGLEAELKGSPWTTAENQKMLDDLIGPLEDLEVELDRLGINYNEMSNQGIKDRLKQIADEQAIFERDRGSDALFASPRTEADILAEQADEAAARAADPNAPPVKAEPKIYINHARIQTADDVKAVLQEMADLDAGAINAKRGGAVVTNEQTIRASSQEYRDLNDLIGREPGPMTASQAVAARRLLASSGEQIVQLARKAQAADATPADLFTFRRAMAVHYAIQSEVVAARTETARALQAWAIPAGATKARSQAISELIANSGGAGDMQALAKAVSLAADNPTAVNTMARELGRGRFGKALYQVWINGLLSSPKTHMVNIMSNAMVSTYAIPERYVSALFSKAFYGGEIQTGEASAQLYGLMKGIRDGARLVAMGNKAAGTDGIGDVFDAFVKAEGVHVNAISAEAFGLDPRGSMGWGIDMLSKLVNAPGSALNAEDKFFKTIGYRMELQAQAYRAAASEGLEGKAFAERVADVILNPPDHIKAEALSAAHYQTFTQPLGKIGQAGQLLLGRVPGARLVVPFVRTPTNILKWTFARTPLAYASSAIRADIAAGGARAAQAHARIALGSMIMLTVIDMAADGTITGKGPDDPAQRKIKMQTGWQPYSVKVGNRWYQYNRTDPIAMIVGLGADMAEIFSNVDERAADEMALAGVVAIANNLSSKTYLSGIYDFVAAFDGNNPTSDPSKYLQDFAGGLVPYSSFLRNAAMAYDPAMKESRTVVYGDDDVKVDAVATWLDNTVNNYRKQIPGQSATLPPMRDLWGEPITRASEIGWAWDFLSPIASRVDNPDPVTQVILDNRVDVSFPPRMISGVKLTNEQYSEFSELAGKGAKEYLDQVIKTPGFKSLSDGPDGMKAEMVKSIINKFRDQARTMMLAKHPELRERMFKMQQERARSLTGN